MQLGLQMRQAVPEIHHTNYLTDLQQKAKCDFFYLYF